MFKTETEKRRFWEGFFKSEMAAQVLNGQSPEATENMLVAVNSPEFGQSREGSVTQVGAGNGDPELLTVKAVRALQDVDLILYDRKQDEALLEGARRDAERLFVGNEKLHQTIVNRVMADAARRGRKVVRLVGGDLASLRRVEQETRYLQSREIRVETIPGIAAEVLPATDKNELRGWEQPAQLMA